MGFVDMHVLIQSHLCANNNTALGTVVGETVRKMFAFYVLFHIGNGTMRKVVTNAARFSSIRSDDVLFEVLRRLDVVRA